MTPETQTKFDLTIGQLDRVLSDLILFAKEEPTTLDEANWQTLKHHAIDMHDAAAKIRRLYEQRNNVNLCGGEGAAPSPNAQVINEALRKEGFVGPGGIEATAVHPRSTLGGGLDPREARADDLTITIPLSAARRVKIVIVE